MTINPVYIRNGLRYLSGALVSFGVLSASASEQIFTHPAIVEAATVVVGFVMAAATEYVYSMAKKFGWRT